MKRLVPIVALLAAVCFAGTAEAKHKPKMQTAPVSKTENESDRAATLPCCISDGDQDGDGVPDRYDHCPNTPKGCKVDDYGCPWDSDQDGVCDGMDECPNTPLGAEVDAQGCSAAQLAARSGHKSQAVVPPPPPPPPPPAPQSEVEKNLIGTGHIRLENVYFETNSEKLLPESETTLNEAGHALEHYPNLKIEVQGHTDTRGSASYNQKLSQKRAESVRMYLLDHFHLNADNYTAKGYGKSRPEVVEKNDEDRQRNRRVELVVENPEELPHGVEVKK